IAEFVGKPAATIYSMGFVTNATIFPALVGKGCLMISDQLNHSSIRFGARISGAVIDMFKHNDMNDLERVLRERISQGQPRTHRPWRKILVAVEGLYSMEGTLCNLPGLVALKKRYKFALYVDEAHSVGALGPRGRGVCDYFGIDPAEIDILMGTLTKSFGANGGYIASSKAIIDKIRVINAGTIYGESPAPAVLAQIQSSLRIISGDLAPGQGEERLQRLAFNSRYLRLGLKRLGFIIYGHDDSPIIPLALYHPAKIPAFSHEMLRRKIAVVVVGYPATPLISSRARFCVSAAHTKDDLDRLLAACDQAGDVLQLKFSSGIAGGQEPLHDGLSNEKEMQVRHIMEAGGKPVVTAPRWRLQDVIRRGVQDVKKPLE
ncbi:serine palmitoyltransferase component, partial [Oleoguttula sp. CCFEE 5521]